MLAGVQRHCSGADFGARQQAAPLAAAVTFGIVERPRGQQRGRRYHVFPAHWALPEQVRRGRDRSQSKIYLVPQLIFD